VTDPNAHRIQQQAEEMLRLTGGDSKRLATLAAQYQLAAKERSKGGALEVVGGVSFHTRKPFIQLSWGAEIGQLDVDAARGHAQLVLEACQNAVADAAIFAWATDSLELDQDNAAQLIDALRRYRHDKWGQPDLETEFSKPPPEGSE